MVVYNTYPCPCPKCFDFGIDAALAHDIATTQQILDAIRDGYEPLRYCIGCISNRCYEGHEHKGAL